MPGAPRPAPLLHRAHWAQMSPGLYLSADESWGSGHGLLHRQSSAPNLAYNVQQELFGSQSRWSFLLRPTEQPQVKPRRARIRAAEVATVIVASAIGLLTGEMLFRAIDGYDLSTPRLVRPPTSAASSGPAVTGAEIAKKHAARIPLAAGMKQEWFDL